MARRGRRNLFAADRQAPGIRLDRAEYELGDLGAAGPEESGEPDDLACVQSEIERLHDPPSSESLGDQNRLILDRRGGARRVLFGAFELPSQHQRNHFRPRQLGDRSAADEAAVAQDRDTVRDFVNLIDEMGDEDNRDAMSLEVPDDLEQERDLVGVEARRRLVEHQHPCVVLERPGDGDELLDGDRIRAERPLDVDVDIEALQTLPGALSRRSPIDESKLLRLAQKRQILGHRHGRDKVDLLIDRADPERLRVARLADVDRATVEPDFAFVPLQGAGQDLDQGRFAGSVLAHERMDFARLHLEVDAIERPHAGKGLRHAHHFNSSNHGFRSDGVAGSRRLLRASLAQAGGAAKGRAPPDQGGTGEARLWPLRPRS